MYHQYLSLNSDSNIDINPIAPYSFIHDIDATNSTKSTELNYNFGICDNSVNGNPRNTVVPSYIPNETHSVQHIDNHAYHHNDKTKIKTHDSNVEHYTDIRPNRRIYTPPEHIYTQPKHNHNIRHAPRIARRNRDNYDKQYRYYNPKYRYRDTDNIINIYTKQPTFINTIKLILVGILIIMFLDVVFNH